MADGTKIEWAHAGLGRGAKLRIEGAEADPQRPGGRPLRSVRPLVKLTQQAEELIVFRRGCGVLLHPARPTHIAFNVEHISQAKAK